RDLDTGTTFLGQQVGYACGDHPYMTFSGDDTSAGGRETATMNLGQAFRDGKWSGTVTVNAVAGWYIPAGGSGPATLTVEFKNRTTGAISGAVSETISPGAQSSCATTVVETINVTEAGTAGQEQVSFTLGSNHF